MQNLLLPFFFLFLLSEQNEGRLGFKSPNRRKDDKIKTDVVKHRNKSWKIGTIKDRGGEDYQDDYQGGKVII